MPARRGRRALIASLPLAALAAATFAAAQADGEGDRRRAVGDWLVEHVGESDGGRLVRMSREGEDFTVEYSRAFWRGNPGPVHGASVTRLNGLCGGFESPQDPNAEVPPAQIRAELADRLARCGVSEADGAAVLEGFERAFALVSEWAEDAAAFTAAEAQAIADYGMDMGMEMNATVTDAAGGAIENSGMTDMNHGVEPESDPGMDLAPDPGESD